MSLTDLLKDYPIISEQVERIELAVLLSELEKVIEQDVEGEIVEFGCYEGTTSLFIARALKQKKSNKKFYVYDSFDGLPEKSSHDQSPLGTAFVRGELRATKAQFIANFRKSQLPLPIIAKGWFHEVESHQLPKSISFAFLDGDYYKSIRASLSLVLPRMTHGGVIIVDDYDNPKLPGVQKAIADTRMQGKRVVKNSLLIVKME